MKMQLFSLNPTILSIAILTVITKRWMFMLSTLSFQKAPIRLFVASCFAFWIFQLPSQGLENFVSIKKAMKKLCQLFPFKYEDAVR